MAALKHSSISGIGDINSSAGLNNRIHPINYYVYMYSGYFSESLLAIFNAFLSSHMTMQNIQAVNIESSVAAFSSAPNDEPKLAIASSSLITHMEW